MERSEQEKGIQTIFVKQEFLDQIKKGSKTAEARPGFSIPIKPIIGEKIIFKSSQDSVMVITTSIETYKSLDYLLQVNDTRRFGSNITKDNAKGIWKRLYPNYKGGDIIVINFKINDHPRN
jgi:ASC-1-like (ASCH) protein